MSARNIKTLHALLDAIGQKTDAADREIAGVTLDSRNAVPGAMFLACAGLTAHGLDYVDEAVSRGAEVVLWESSPTVIPPTATGGVVIEVPNLTRHVGAIASAFYGDPSSRLKMVGITGTNGKTSVSHLAAQALSSYGVRCAVAGTLGYGFIDSLEPASHTTPDAVRLHGLLAQFAGSGASAVAMEVSSHALQQHRVEGVRFHTAVFTNLTRDHLDYHGNITSYASAKKRLFRMDGLQSAVVNADDDVGREVLAELSPGIGAYAFAMHEESLRDVRNATKLFAESVRFDEQGLEIDVRMNDDKLVLRSPLFGRFNVLNLLAVMGVLCSLGIPPVDAVRTLATVKPVRGRMERLGGGERPLVIIDYAHTPDALAHILAAAREHCAGTLACVFGCGGDRDRGKRPEMGRIAESLADSVCVTDDNPRTEDGDLIVQEILDGMTDPGRVNVTRDRAAAIRDAINDARKGDVIVIAGKGHEDYQLIGTRRYEFSDRDVALTALGLAA